MAKASITLSQLAIRGLLARQTINPATAMGVALRNGWTFAATGGGLIIGGCKVLLDEWPDGLALRLDTIVPRDVQCEFRLFGGQVLKEGWTFQSIDVTNSGCTEFAVVTRPAPGDAEIPLAITATFRTSGLAIGLSKWCMVGVDNLILLGPHGADWRTAFERP